MESPPAQPQPPAESMAAAGRRGRPALRIAVLIASAVVALLVLRLVWGAVAQRRLDRALAAVRASGDPVTVQELFAHLGVDESQNAVPLILKAIAEANRVSDAGIESPAQSALEYAEYPPFPPRWHKLENVAVRANVAAFSLLRESRQRPLILWPLSSNANLKQLSGARGLALAVGDASLDSYVHGDYSEAVQRIQDLLYLGRAVGARPSLIAHSVASGIEALTIDRLMVISSGLSIRSNDAHNAMRAQFRRILENLLDTSAEEQSLRRAFVARRVEEIEEARKLWRRTWVVRPMLTLDLVHVLSADKVVLRACTNETWPAARMILKTAPVPQAGLMHRLSDRFLGPTARTVESDMRYRMLRHMAVIALAVRLYRLDHEGHWPDSLEDLRPSYLSVLPVDPFSADGHPPRYLILRHVLPGGGDRHLLYSLGPNCQDDGLKGQTAPKTPQYGWNAKGGSPDDPGFFWDDQYLDLSLWAPTPTSEPSATEP